MWGNRSAEWSVSFFKLFVWETFNKITLCTIQRWDNSFELTKKEMIEVVICLSSTCNIWCHISFFPSAITFPIFFSSCSCVTQVTSNWDMAGGNRPPGARLCVRLCFCLPMRMLMYEVGHTLAYVHDVHARLGPCRRDLDWTGWSAPC